jgi:hypothetical protein
MVDKKKEAPEETTTELEDPKSHEDAFDELWGSKKEDLEDDIEEDDEVDDDSGEEPELEKEPRQDKPKEAAPAPDDPYAWIESLPEEQRDMARQLKHEALSDRGRVSALSRKVNDISRELEQKAARSKVESAGEDSDAATAPKPSEALRRLQEEYPELGKELSEVLLEERKTLKEEFSKQLTPLQERQTADALASERNRLDQEAAEIFNTKETGTHWQDVVKSEDFSAWLNMQPRFVQDAAKTSNSAQDGIEILRMYEEDYQAELAKLEKPEKSASGGEDATKRGDKVKARRQQRQATTVSPASKPAGTDTDGLAGDHEAMFNAMWGRKK